MNLWSHTIFCTSFKNARSLFWCEESCITEDINELSQFLCTHSWYHFVDNQINVCILSAFIFTWNSMGTEECCYDFQACCFFDTTDNTKHFQFVFRIQSITALYLHTASSFPNNLINTLHSLLIEFVFVHFMKTICRVEDATSTLCNFRIAESTNLVNKLLLSATGKDNVCMRVTP